MNKRTVLWCVGLLLLAVSCGYAATSGTSEPEEDRLATEVEDPTAILTQFQFQDIYTPRNFQTSAQTNTIQLRPVIPVTPFSLFPFDQIIRPTFKVQSFASSSSSSTMTEYGDMELFDLLVFNWPGTRGGTFAWGVGPTFVFPTGRDKATKNAWQVGPGLGTVFKGIPHLTMGFLFQNPISFAYTSSSATPQSQMQFQPRISYTIGHGWYVKSSDSTWTVDWRRHGSTTIPVSLGVGKVWKFDGLDLNPWVAGEWTTYRQNTSITPMYSVRFGMTLLFPDFVL